MKKRKFKIGQEVIVDLNKQLVATYDAKDNRVVKKIIEDRGWPIENEENKYQLAVITGIKTLQEGKYYKGSNGRSVGYYSDDYDYDPSILKVSNQIDVWCVRLGYKNKELYYFEEDLTKSGWPSWATFPESIKSVFREVIKRKIPYFWAGGYPKHWREMMRRDSKSFPRDEKGRWKKT